MRIAISGIAAGITALVLGLLISGASSAAKAAEIDRQRAVAADRAQAAASTETTSAEIGSYHQRLQEALAQLDVTYRDLQARDAAYRSLLERSDANVAQLQSANVRLAAQLATAADQLARLQSAQATVARAPAPSAPRQIEHHDDDD